MCCKNGKTKGAQLRIFLFWLKYSLFLFNLRLGMFLTCSYFLRYLSLNVLISMVLTQQIACRVTCTWLKTCWNEGIIFSLIKQSVAICTANFVCPWRCNHIKYVSISIPFGTTKKENKNSNVSRAQSKTWFNDAINLSFAKEKSKCLIICFYIVVWVC